MSYIVCSKNSIVLPLHFFRNHGTINMSLKHMTYSCTKFNLQEMSVSDSGERLVFAILHRNLVSSHVPHSSNISLYVSCTSLKTDEVNRTRKIP